MSDETSSNATGAMVSDEMSELGLAVGSGMKQRPSRSSDALVTMRPEPRRIARPQRQIAYAAVLERDERGLVLRCERKAWVKTFDKDGVVTSTVVEPKSLWFAVNVDARLLVMPRDIRVDTIGHYHVVGMLEDYKTVYVAHAGSDQVELGEVCVIKLNGWAK